MNSTRTRAERLWIEIAADNFGSATGPAAIEQALRDAAYDERNRILQEIRNTCWSYRTISGGFYLRCVWHLITRPRMFFCSYYKCIQLALVAKIERE